MIGEIKSIVDEIEQQKKLIKESFALNDESCIKKDIDTENTYTIMPSKNNKKILINAIENHDIFNQQNLTFEHCIFNDTISMAMTFTKKIRFSYCTFNRIVSFEDSEFQEKVSFERSSFKDEAIFISAHFHKGAYFTGSIFEKAALFTETIFKDNAYFDNTIFKDRVSFQIGEFHRNAHFYKTNFKEISEKNIAIEDVSCFLQAIFNGSINLTGTNLFDFDFEQFRSIIDTSNDKAKTIEEFRNVFKNIKDGLIKGSNLLDASRFHKMELYAKELELKYKREEEIKNSKCLDMFKFLLGNGKDFIDEIQLYCYRLTSDHHTDLLLILNNVIFLIALFGIANLMLIPLDKAYTISFFKLNVIESIVCLIFVGTAICFIFDSWKIFMLKPIYLLLIFLFLAIIFVFSPILVLVVLSIYSAVLLFAILLLLLLSYFLIKAQKILDLKQCIFIFSYFISAFMLFSNPSSILPILGKLIENKSAETCLFVIGKVKILCCGGNSFAPETLNLIYMLFLFLLLFSLQKTARKNTIVPS